MEHNKKILILTIIGVLLFVTIGVGVTAAFYSTGDKQTGLNSFSSGCLNINIENESNSITLNNVYPKTDIEGLDTEGYTFTIRNTCSTSANYQINLESLNEVSNTLLPDYIKVALSSDTNANIITKLKNNTSITPSITNAYEAHNLYTGSIAGNTTKTFNLKLWLDYDATKEQAASKTFTSKINVIANPELTPDTTPEVTFTNSGTTVTGATTATSVKYCVSNNNICTPTTSISLSNNKFQVVLPEKETKQLLCTSLNNGKTICSEGISTMTLKGMILAANGGADAIKAKGNPDFSKTSCTSGTYNGTARTCGEDTTGMYAMEDDNGMSYYFRGTPTNNYVKFGKYASNYPDVYVGYYSAALTSSKEYTSLSECQNATSYNTNCTLISKAGKDMYWRIIRINGDGTIRMIYDGTEYHANGTSATDKIAIFGKTFNSSRDNNEYLGYTYAIGSKRGIGTDSNAKKEIDKWYTSSGLSNYSNYLSDSGFCGDRTSTTTDGGVPNNTGGTGSTMTYYGAYYRLYKNKIPTLKCATISYGSGEVGNKADVYTVDALKGNGELQYPIGLITADEAAVAGGVFDGSNSNYAYYLYNGSGYWTMSPYSFGSLARAFNVSRNGYIAYESNGLIVSQNLIPVINIDPSKINNVTIDSNGVYVIEAESNHDERPEIPEGEDNEQAELS